MGVIILGKLRQMLKRLLGTRALNESGIGEMILELIPKMGVLSMVCLCAAMIIDFDLRNIPGFAIGYIYACFCLIYLARTCADAAGCGNIKKAKAMMRRCYLYRFFGLFMLGAAALLFRIFSFAGVLIPQLFPKILLSVGQLSERRRK